MRRALALATVGLLCGMTVTACSNDEPAASPTVSSSSPSPSTATPSQPTEPTESTEPTEPTPSADPTQPVLPDIAKERSRAGAKAFIEHYVSVLNTAYADTEPKLLHPYTPKGCSLCASFLQVLERVHKEGGSQTGGTWTPSRIDLATRESSDRWIFITTVDVAKGRSRGSSDSPPQEIVEDQIRVEIRLRWSKNRWTLDDVAPV